MRRLGARWVVVLAVAVTAASCGGGGDGGRSATAGGGGAFPVTIDHKHGTTRIDHAPRRVVTVGYQDQDFALALGVRPIAVREWFGDKPYATWPWARAALGAAKPKVLPAGELNFEQIAALHPDLILGIYSGMTASDYSKLSRIAPTVAQAGHFVDFGMPWEQQLLLTGEALGREGRAKRIVAAVRARFAKARREHPEFARATAVFAYLGQDGSFGAYSPQDPRGRFLHALGFKAAPQIARLAGDRFFVTISGERLRLLDHDVLVAIQLPDVATSRATLVEKDSLYGRLDTVRDGRDVYPTTEVGAALSFSSPLSLPVAIDGLVPELAAAVARPHGR